MDFFHSFLLLSLLPFYSLSLSSFLPLPPLFFLTIPPLFLLFSMAITLLIFNNTTIETQIHSAQKEIEWTVIEWNSFYYFQKNCCFLDLKKYQNRCRRQSVQEPCGGGKEGNKIFYRSLVLAHVLVNIELTKIIFKCI